MGKTKRFLHARAGLLYRRWAQRRAVDDEKAIAERAWRIVSRKQYCLVVTSGQDGPSARVVEPFGPDGRGTVLFGTDPASRKVDQIRETGRCLLVYQDDRRRACVTLECEAALRPVDAAVPRFRQGWRAFWPKGPDSDFINIVCTPTALEIWDGLAVIAPEPFGRRQARLLWRDGTWNSADSP